MRISDKSESARGNVAKKERGSATKGVAGTSKPLFAGRLTQVAKANTDYQGELQRLKEEVDQAGDLLEKEPTIANFKVFRTSIAALAKKVTTEAYRIEVLGGGVTGRSHEIVQVIDKEADQLYHLVMKEQKDHIRIVAQILKIKGLVVDLTL